MPRVLFKIINEHEKKEVFLSPIQACFYEQAYNSGHSHEKSIEIAKYGEDVLHDSESDLIEAGHFHDFVAENYDKIKDMKNSDVELLFYSQR